MSYLTVLEKLRDLGMHGMAVSRDGETVAEAAVGPYRLDKPHVLNSLTKSFVSTAVGFCVQEGLLSLTDTVTGGMSVKHLLMMATGHTKEPYGWLTETDPIGAFLESEVQTGPGSVFFYNTPGSHMLAHLVERASGVTAEEFLRPRLFEPLGFGEWVWDKFPDGSCIGGVGLWVSARDVLKFGNFLLREGVYGGKRLLDAGWIREAVRSHIIQSGIPGGHLTSGYGYQFWMNRTEGYRADGAFGQFCIVIPSQRLVISINSGSHDMNGMLDVIFDGLIPALSGPEAPRGDFIELDPPPDETAWQKRLRRALLEGEKITYKELFS
jgi:CubicO group peptidase (beta-lactamase class C family)